LVSSKCCKANGFAGQTLAARALEQHRAWPWSGYICLRSCW